MFDTHLYYRGKQTALRPGDIIRNDVGNKFTFYRNGERMLIGQPTSEHWDDAYVVFMNHSEFLALLSFASGYRLVETDESAEYEHIANAWSVEP